MLAASYPTKKALREGPPVTAHTATRRTPKGRAKIPGATPQLLTFTSKMDRWSWGMTAGVSCPCAGKCRKYCYAMAGMYRFPRVKAAYRARFDWATRCMRTPEGRDEFVRTMVAAIRSESARFGLDRFRIHDAGDFFSEAYTRCWIEICWHLPHIRFWAPTKSHRARWVRALIDLNALPNVAISPSGDGLDEPAPVVPGLAGGSMVVTDPGVARTAGVHLCAARENGGHCGTCNLCYTQAPRAYPLHGRVAA